MFIRKIRKVTKNKTYTSVYLAESYRQNGKVRHRHLANLSHWPQDLVDKLQKVLKGEKFFELQSLNLSLYKSFGAIKVVSEISERLCIKQALGSGREGKLALFQIAGRIITQGSRYYLANEWKQLQAIEEIFRLKNFNHNDLYKNLEWLSKNQSQIERKIYQYRSKNKKIKNIFLYDVTSSYLEGEQNELAAYGYNRDKKEGKKQLVIGLLTDESGYPVSVEVFKGNRSDMTTVSNQLKKLKENFGVERVVFVGDKGMIKSEQISEIQSSQYKWHYLTSITKEQIRTLISAGIVQLELFTDKVLEVEAEEGVRYILRRNPQRAEQLKENRESKIEAIKSFVLEQNEYLKKHKRAKFEVALRKVNEKIEKLKLSNIVKTIEGQREIKVSINIEELDKTEQLDGCYVIKTDVPQAELDAQTAHDRYKDLSAVEFAFRTMKTTLEEIRPVYVRKEENTRGHVFVVMLAYMIIKYITDALGDLSYSRKYIIECLDKISYIEYEFENEKIRTSPKNLLPCQKQILEKLKIKIK